MNDLTWKISEFEAQILDLRLPASQVLLDVMEIRSWFEVLVAWF